MTLDQINSAIESKLYELNKLRREKSKIEGKLNNSQSKFLLKCSYDIILEEIEIWPDGDAPMKPRVKDAQKVIEEWTDPPSHENVMEEWNLLPEDGFNLNEQEIPFL